MLCDLLRRRRWLVSLIALWGIGMAVLPRLADAAPLPPTRAEGAAGDLDRMRALLEQRIVRERLQALGVSEAEAAEAWSRLTPAEQAEMAARVDELGAGGDAAAAIAVAIIVAMLVILVLELLGRRVISRP
jgi:hypothetical protein